VLLYRGQAAPCSWTEACHTLLFPDGQTVGPGLSSVTGLLRNIRVMLILHSLSRAKRRSRASQAAGEVLMCRLSEAGMHSSATLH
jgi:hypothetical protein